MVKFNNLAGDQSISNTAIERANDVPFYEESEPRDADTLGGLEPSFYSNNSNYILFRKTDENNSENSEIRKSTVFKYNDYGGIISVYK
jgi:hypothetical protein